MLKKKNTLAYRDAFWAGRLGIRKKILIYLTVLVGFIMTVIWVCQIALLYQFYQNYRANQVKNAASAIVQNIDHDDLESLAQRLCEENEICLMLLDSEGEEILSVDTVPFCVLHHMGEKQLSRVIESAPEDGTARMETLSNAPFRTIRYDKEDFEGPVPEAPAQDGRTMLSVQKVTFEDGTSGTLLINVQINPTGMVLVMLRRQFMVILLVILIVTVIVGHFLSKSVSEPIIETNTAAKALSESKYERPPHSGGYKEIAELNDTLVQAAEDLGKVENLQRELVANISHDLRTPLTMIQGYAETMRDIPDERTPENMQVIIDEANRLSSLVNEVLEFSRLRSQSVELNVSEFDLSETIRAIAGRVDAMTGKDGYSVKCEVPESVIVKGDPKRVEQVIYNLIGNALTYTGEDKTVTIREEDDGTFAKVSIHDTGKGIAPEELPYIWDRYYRTKESHKRAVIGSGLGLNICRGILEKHQVPYGVDSKIGEGTTFWFEMEKA